MPDQELKYSRLAGPSVPPLQRERRDKLLAWMRDKGPMTVTEIVLCAWRIYDGASDPGVARDDLNQLERYGLVRCAGWPRQWSAK